MQHIYDQPQFAENWFTYPGLYKQMVKKFPTGSKFVEIGCWKGKSSAYMTIEIINSGKNIDFYCIDVWDNSSEDLKMLDTTHIYEVFLSNMKPLNEHFIPIRMPSVEAAKHFKDNSLDFVFIDADHSYESIKEDIIAWLPKVKEGGILAGHDYHISGNSWKGVIKAVNELIDDFDTSEFCWIYNVTKKDKLIGIPSIYYISIEDSIKRRTNLEKQLKKFNIKNYVSSIYKRYEEGDHNITGEKASLLRTAYKGAVTSHLKTIKKWYDETNEDIVIICEDDLSLKTVKYWNFTWKDFYDKLPEYWDCIQMIQVRYPYRKVCFSQRDYYDWCAGIYLINRRYAEILLKRHYQNGKFILETVCEYPNIENILFAANSNVYAIPLFVEDILNSRSACLIGKEEQSEYHVESYYEVLNWWRKNGLKTSIDELFVQYESPTKQPKKTIWKGGINK